MAVDKLFDLGTQHDVPVGASFAPSGWYAPFSASIVHFVLTRLDLEQMFKDDGAGLTTALEDIDEDTEKSFRDTLVQPALSERMGESDWYKYHFTSRDGALPLCRLVDQEAPGADKRGRFIPASSQAVWRVEAPLDDVVSLTDDAKEKFERDVISWESDVKAMQKNSKDWFKWHGLILPCMVNAYAKLRGWKAAKTPGFDIGELTLPEDQIIVTDKFQSEMVGNTDIGLENSKLFVRRKALWNALGEDNVKASNPDDTESSQLKEALKVAVSTWNSPVYARVLQVPSPRMDDTWDGRDGSKQRTKIPVVTEFFRNEKAAVKAYEAEVEARGQEPVSAPASSDDGKDEQVALVPEAWAEIPDEWLVEVGKLKAEIGKKPKPVLKKTLEEMSQRLEDEYMVTPEDVLQAWDNV